MRTEPSAELIKYLTDTLEAEGYRVTTARKVIATALVSSDGHCSADELVELVREMTPGVGRMTVYRTLDLFCKLGLARPFYPGSGAAHYAIMDSGHHHHLVCSSCGEVIDVDDCDLEAIAQERIGDRFNFEVQGHLLEFYGLCSDCRT